MAYGDGQRSFTGYRHQRRAGRGPGARGPQPRVSKLDAAWNRKGSARRRVSGRRPMQRFAGCRPCHQAVRWHRKCLAPDQPLRLDHRHGWSQPSLSRHAPEDTRRASATGLGSMRVFSHASTPGVLPTASGLPRCCCPCGRWLSGLEKVMGSAWLAMLPMCQSVVSPQACVT